MESRTKVSKDLIHTILTYEPELTLIFKFMRINKSSNEALRELIGERGISTVVHRDYAKVPSKLQLH